MRYFYLFFLTMFASDSNALAVDFDHYFHKDSITIKPVRSDYNSDEAYAADSIVYGVPRRCIWWSSYGLEGLSETQKGQANA